MKLQKKSIRNLIAFLVFMLLAWTIFVHLTYLFRNTHRNSRRNILGYYNEEVDLDVVVIGGSNVYRYWDPMYAWNEYGFASYSYSASAFHPAAYIAAIEDVLKTQSPEVIVIEARPLITEYETDSIPVGLRNILDSLDYGLNRLRAVKYFCDVYDIEWSTASSLYIDLIQYHDNYDVFTKQLNWELADNRVNGSVDSEQFYKGFAIAAKHVVRMDPTDKMSDEYGNISATSERIFRDLLEYCGEEEIQIMMVASPFAITTDESKKLNTFMKIAEEYDVKFLNTNLYYEEMGLDFYTDFYDSAHVNMLGAQKYTQFVADYLVENYELADCREDEAYASWNDIYRAYSVERKAAVEKIEKIVAEKTSTYEKEAVMKETESASHWTALADDGNITVFTIMCEPNADALSEESESVLKKFGITADDMLKNSSFVGVFCDKNKQSSFTDKEITGKVGERERSYEVSITDKSLLIGGEKYLESVGAGIYMVAYDNNLNQVVDIICLSVDEDGALLLEHLEY